MGNRIAAFFDNDSPFGRLMNRCWLIIAANLCFCIFSIPIVTIGASMCGMYRVMLKTLRGDGDINPLKQFWKGFKENFKQATIAWLIALVLLIVGFVDYQICRSATGGISNMQFVFVALGIIWALTVLYLFPTMTAFENKLTKLLSNAMFFAIKNPLKAIAVAAIHVIPVFITYTDVGMQPLFAFIWVFFGFGLIAYIASKILLSEFKEYLPEVDEYGDFV
jgi:uncharacterized membrane protein YesL